MKNYKTNKALFSLVLLSMLIQMFAVSPFTNVKADASNQIVKDLEVVGKTDKYEPGEIIKLEGNWALPDDGENGVWSEGDTFSISIPYGYKKMKDQIINVKFDEKSEFEYVVENVRKPIEITGSKQWFDADGKEIESQEAIVLELLQDGKVIEKQVLPKGEYKFSFNDLLEFDEDGNRIEYTINEVSIDEYKKAEIIKQEDNTVLIVNQQNELPVEPETPEPEEPEKPVTLEPVVPTEPEKPEIPEPVEPEEPGELLPPVSYDPIIEEGVLSVNKNLGSRPSDKELLP